MQLKDTNLHYLLKHLGLTYNEAEVYLYLLCHGTKYGSDIHGDLKMDKSSCYRSLKSLAEKDLVYLVGEERNRQFTANPPEHVEALVREQERKLSQTKKSLQEFQSLIQKYVKSDYKDKNVTIITTESGHRQYMESRHRCKSKLIRELGGRIAAESYITDYDTYIAQHVEKRVEAGIFLKQLVPFGEVDNKWERSSVEMYKEAKELPKEFSASASFAVWDDYITLTSKDKGQYIGVMIKDPLIAQLMISMFDFIWKNLPKGSK